MVAEMASAGSRAARWHVLVWLALYSRRPGKASAVPPSFSKVLGCVLADVWSAHLGYHQLLQLQAVLGLLELALEKRSALELLPSLLVSQ